MQLLRIMKKMIIGSIIMLAAFSCDKYEYDDSAIWDKLEEIERHRDETVHSGYETLCNRLNANISSIHTILQAKTEGEYVTNVISMMDDGKDVGYLINFSVTGSVPVFLDLEADMLQIPDLGLKQDKDGTHYWTLYSAWLLDNDGNKVSDPPLLDEGSGYWHLSLDDGMTWEQLESIGSDAETSSGTFLFEDVDISENDAVSFVLADGTAITFPVKQGYDPWDGYLDPDVYEEQDIINLTNVLMANMDNCNLATRHIMEIAYNFWKRRNEFIYCSQTALDTPWDYWSYVGFRDGNTGFTVSEGNGGYKRIDCSTFVRYIVNGIDYYSSPYYNALEWTEVTQGALDSKGKETSSSDSAVCRTGKIYLRHGRRHILESASASKYRFTKVFAYDSSGKMIENLTDRSEFVLPQGTEYVRAEMKVRSADDYLPAVKGTSPARILRCLRIRENERLAVNADCPTASRRANAMSRWFDENGYGLAAFEDYNPLFWEDSDFEPGTVVFMGKKSAKAEYKGITHVTLYIGGGYIIHSQAPRGLLGGEGIMIDKLRDMELRYDRPFCSAASPKYHTNYDEERSLQ